jgi:hypothetical protein
MTLRSELGLEAFIAQCARAYRDAFEHGNTSDAEEQLRDLGAALARLMAEQLVGDSSWIPGGWVDDVTMKSTVLHANGSLEMRGLMIWGKGGTTAQWVEPFLALIELSSDGHALRTWKLACGSSKTGIGKFTYENRHRQVDPASVKDWLFVFTEYQSRAQEPISPLRNEIQRFFDELEVICEECPELTDTDVRETLARTLTHYFVWGQPMARLPVQYAMFSKEADVRVAAAVRVFLERSMATNEVRLAPVGQQRLNLLQDPSYRTRSGRQYDEFIGYAEAPLPLEALPEFWFHPRDDEK